MFWLGIIVILIVIAIIIALVSYIRGELYFSRVKDDDTLSMNVRAFFGLVRYRYVIPIIQFKGLAQGIIVKSETATRSSDGLKDEMKDHLTKEKVLDSFKQGKIALENTLNMYDWMKQTLAKVECTELKWITRIGIGDAPETAITTGAIWGIKSSLIGFAARFVRLRTKPCVDVVPQYNEPQFSTEFRLAGRIRVWFILFAGIRLLARAAKIKGGIRAWYQIFLKARAKMAS
ncbi:DUF2953 domain-containing protein [Paenibacillus sedimenti]|uniref:DUF2953 domain-containing protein n=1 Tax=Paenibacillus sedimenti TaxID=2770274 RepID=A0A926KMN0_9BACL|nr:DUF2953 domain-containing protein [Paenibacillus sedimenti]MBD0380642.1 DUF2953 domain-containing protein [Paenibacillus sedimenti]